MFLQTRCSSYFSLLPLTPALLWSNCNTWFQVWEESSEPDLFCEVKQKLLASSGKLESKKKKLEENAGGFKPLNHQVDVNTNFAKEY